LRKSGILAKVNNWMEKLESMTEKIIPLERSIMLAADVQPERSRILAHQIANVAGLSSVKVGFELGLGLGLAKAVQIFKEADPNLVVVYDHQKAGNDIPDTAANFARTMKRGQIDAAILFPFTGRRVEEHWIKELQDTHIGVIIGSEMTHNGFLYSEGGRIADDRLTDMYEQAVELGVRDFVVPGNKPDKILEYRKFFQDEAGEGNFTLYAPGFVTQGGEISEAGKIAGSSWHAIVGRGIFEAADVRLAAIEHAQQILTA